MREARGDELSSFKFQGVLYEHDVDGLGITRLRSKGDAVLFGDNDTEAMKAKWSQARAG